MVEKSVADKEVFERIMGCVPAIINDTLYQKSPFSVSYNFTQEEWKRIKGVSTAISGSLKKITLDGEYDETQDSKTIADIRKKYTISANEVFTILKQTFDNILPCDEELAFLSCGRIKFNEFIEEKEEKIYQKKKEIEDLKAIGAKKEIKAQIEVLRGELKVLKDKLKEIEFNIKSSIKSRNDLIGEALSKKNFMPIDLNNKKEIIMVNNLLHNVFNSRVNHSSSKCFIVPDDIHMENAKTQPYITFSGINECKDLSPGEYGNQCFFATQYLAIKDNDLSNYIMLDRGEVDLFVEQVENILADYKPSLDQMAKQTYLFDQDKKEYYLNTPLGAPAMPSVIKRRYDERVKKYQEKYLQALRQDKSWSKKSESNLNKEVKSLYRSLTIIDSELGGANQNNITEINKYPKAENLVYIKSPQMSREIQEGLSIYYKGLSKDGKIFFNKDKCKKLIECINSSLDENGVLSLNMYIKNKISNMVSDIISDYRFFIDTRKERLNSTCVSLGLIEKQSDDIVYSNDLDDFNKKLLDSSKRDMKFYREFYDKFVRYLDNIKLDTNFNKRMLLISAATVTEIKNIVIQEMI